MSHATPPRVVLDTNVVLSALVFGKGAAAALRAGWQRSSFTPLVCTATAQELLRVLAYPKFRLSGTEQESLLGDYLPYTTVVQLPDPPPRVPDCRDPADMPFLHLAVAGRARWLVSGDRDLLTLAGELRTRPACRIVALDTFLHSLHLLADRP